MQPTPSMTTPRITLRDRNNLLANAQQWRAHESALFRVTKPTPPAAPLYTPTTRTLAEREANVQRYERKPPLVIITSKWLYNSEAFGAASFER